MKSKDKVPAHPALPSVFTRFRTLHRIMKYVSLDHRQKRLIAAEAERRRLAHRPATGEVLSIWAQEQFGLEKRPNRATITRILQSPPPPPPATAGGRIEKTVRATKGQSHALEVALYQWVCDMFNKRINLSHAIIRQKAYRLQDTLNAQPQSSTTSSLKFSDGWVSNFKHRWKLRTVKSHGEEGDADVSAVAEVLPSLRDTLASYDRRDRFNADECGLNYCAPPDKTVAHCPLPGRKKAKERITVLLCCNADGSERLEPMFIGNAARPRAFKKKSGHELGLDYHSNKKAWMTSDLFMNWLQRFNAWIARKPDRKVILLIDNCSAHGNDTNIPHLSNVTVKFLPPNTTSKIQPLDAGIIASLKLRYRAFQLERALDLIDQDVKAIYKVDILSAMFMVKTIWSDMDAKVIDNCWRHTKLESGDNRVEHNLLRDDEDRVLSAMDGLIHTNARMSIGMLINLPGEEDHSQIVTDDALIDHIISSNGNDISDEEEDDDKRDQAPSRSEALRAISIVKHYALSRDLLSNSLHSGLCTLQRRIREETVNSQKQLTLDEMLE